MIIIDMIMMNIMMISVQVKKIFPTMDSLVEAKFLLPHEVERLERVDFR